MSVFSKKPLKSTKLKPLFSYCSNWMEWRTNYTADPLVQQPVLSAWPWYTFVLESQDLTRVTELKPTPWRKKLRAIAMIKLLLTKLLKKKKNESLAPLVLINSSFKRTSVFRFRVFDWLSNLHNRVKHLCTRVFCLYMCYVLMGQESLFHLANNDNYDAELIGKIFKMIILLRFERTF